MDIYDLTYLYVMSDYNGTVNANSAPDVKPNAWSELRLFIAEVHREIESAARRKETGTLLERTDWLRRALELETKHQALLAEVERLVSERSESQNEHDTEKSPAEQEAGGHDGAGSVGLKHHGGKARADECRDAYLEREKTRGNTLSRVRRGYYKNAAGLTMGITYSSEDRRKPCPWFLNLKDGQFEEAVLLCEISQESVQVIHLPKTFFHRYGRQLSRDKKGQVKFNIAQRNGRFALQVPGLVGWVDVTDYLEGEPLHCPHIEYE